MKTLTPYQPRLETERLSLTLFDGSPAHYQVTLEAINNPVAYAEGGDLGIHSQVDLDHIFRRTRLRRSLFSSLTAQTFSKEEVVSQNCHYVVSIKNGENIGGVSLAQRGAHLAPDIGWAFLPAHHSQGYASEAAAELLRYVRENLAIKEVIAWLDPKNLASCKVATKIGMVEGGQMKDRDSGVLKTLYVLPGMKIEGIPEIGL